MSASEYRELAAEAQAEADRLAATGAPITDVQKHQREASAYLLEAEAQDPPLGMSILPERSGI